MTGKSLILWGNELGKGREKYLLTMIYKKFRLPAALVQKHHNELSRLSARQLREIGGNILEPGDQQKAMRRALKLVNLGLEDLSKKTGTVQEGESIFDEHLGAKVLATTSLEEIYQVGEEMFLSNQKSVHRILKAVEIRIKDIWFRLIRQEDHRRLKELGDLDTCHGTLQEFRQLVEFRVKLEKKATLFPYLPLNDDGYHLFRHLGTSQKGNYPSSEGIVDILLTSLIIACLFRNQHTLYERRRDSDCRLKFIKDAMEITEGENKEFLLNSFAESFANIGRSIEFDISARQGMRNLQQSFLADIFVVTLDEVAKFSELLFWEKEDFDKKAVEIRQTFVQYFFVAGQMLGLRDSKKNLVSTAYSVMLALAEYIYRDVKEFYRTVSDLNVTNASVARFWAMKVCLSSTKNDVSLETRAIASEASENILASDLAQMAIAHIVRATRDFLKWPIEKQEEFFKFFNIQRIMLEKYESDRLLIVFLHNLSPHDIGWNLDAANMLGHERYAPVSHERAEEKAMVKYIQGIDWTQKFMDRLLWNSIHPGTIVLLWQAGSDHVRDILFNHRARFKVTLKAIKAHYIFDHSDLRLLDYIMDRAIDEELIRTRAAWENLLSITENYRQARIIINLKYREVAEELARKKR